MPDTETPSTSGSAPAESGMPGLGRAEPSADAATPNLPVLVVPQPAAAAEAADGWLGRIARLIFSWKTSSIRHDLEVVLQAGSPGESAFSPEERTMLRNILRLRERRVADVMVPRADIVAVQQEIPLGELVKVFEHAAHSRLVVYNDTLDDPVGMVHIRDLIAFMTARAAVKPDANGGASGPLRASFDLTAIDFAMPLSTTKLTRSLLFVPPSMTAIDLMAKMQATRMHLALVIDEYGGTDGLVSMEDIVEQIVGEIEDEHDEDSEPAVVPQPDGTLVADARANIEDVALSMGPEFDIGEAAEEVDTLGGYLATRAGRVPVRGELVPGPGPFEFEVLDADPRRVKRVKIHRRKSPRPSRGREARRREGEPEPEPAPGLAPEALSPREEDVASQGAAPRFARRP